MALGLANDLALPPFFPVGRNQDGVFGVLIQLMAPSTFLGHIPVAVFHDADSRRAYKRVGEFRIADLVICLCMNLVPPHRRGSFDLLRYLGRELLYLAELPEHEFLDYIEKTALTHIRLQLCHIEEVAKQVSNAPKFWREELNRAHRELGESCLRQDWFLPVELTANLDLEQAREHTRGLVRLSGLLFYHWSDLIDAARALRQKGIRITKELA
jgi:hypothetical protein